MIALLLFLACSQPFDEVDTAGETGEPDSDPGPGPDTGDSADDTAVVEPLPLCINEVMPENVASAYDADGLALDWVELYNPGDAAVDLAGWTLSDDGDEPGKAPLDGLTVGQGEFLLVWAGGDTTPGADHVGFKLSEDGGQVGVYDPDGQGQVVQYGSVEPDFAVARLTDCCTGEGCLDFQFRGTPGYSNEPIVYETVPLIAAQSTWSYWTGLEVDPAWLTSSFDDSAWPTGPAPLGYGDAQATVIPYGDDAANKWVTSWFRLGFEVADADTFDTMTVGIARDDGAVVYVNGIEVLRDNMPDGEVLSTTLALASSVSETGFYSYELDAFPLVEGHNVVAVEVHQYSVSSSDLSFDLQLSASRVIE